MLSVTNIITEKVSTSSVTNYTSDAELLREAILAEYDTANLYKQMANRAENEEVRRVMLHVSEEEIEHVGEFEKLLEKYDPQHKDAKLDGEEEVKDMGIE